MDQHLLQITEASTTIYGIKGKNIMKQYVTKDYNQKIIDFGWMDGSS
jgi:hypothetical protein